jgi:hypothetical protein
VLREEIDPRTSACPVLIDDAPDEIAGRNTKSLCFGPKIGELR